MTSEGSPPPMRGKADAIVACVSVLRITPAYAGKSKLLFGKRSISQDHPRLCGEKNSRFLWSFY